MYIGDVVWERAVRMIWLRTVSVLGGCNGLIVFILVKFSLHGAMELCFFYVNCHDIYKDKTLFLLPHV